MNVFTSILICDSARARHTCEDTCAQHVLVLTVLLSPTAIFKPRHCAAIVALTLDPRHILATSPPRIALTSCPYSGITRTFPGHKRHPSPPSSEFGKSRSLPRSSSDLPSEYTLVESRCLLWCTSSLIATAPQVRGNTRKHLTTAQIRTD